MLFRSGGFADTITPRAGYLYRLSCANNPSRKENVLGYCNIYISPMSEENLVSPFLSFFSFGQNLKMPVGLYVV